MRHGIAKRRTPVSDKAFVFGMGELALAFPWPPLDSVANAARLALYRRHLGGLTDEEWRKTVSDAIDNEKLDRFPTVGKLIEYSIHAREVIAARESPEPRSIEAQRETVRKGLAMIRAALANGGKPDGKPETGTGEASTQGSSGSGRTNRG